jgi:hypothetical protein
MRRAYRRNGKRARRQMRKHGFFATLKRYLDFLAG